MISFNNLGYMGYLGNQMFQYAALKGISLYNGYEYSIPKFSDMIGRPFGCDMFRCFNILETKTNQNSLSINEKTYEFDESFFNECSDNIDLVGYFQTEKYFKHIENEIRKDFIFNGNVYKQCLDYKNNLSLNTPTIALHVRRGDYLTDPKFEVLSLDYYNNALKLLPKFPVIIFSNDTKWCKENFTSKNIFISEFTDPCLDLCLMSLCDYHIIANSSFSWWGSWLANSKQTIAPKKWFCGEFANLNTSDLYLSSWILI